MKRRDCAVISLGANSLAAKQGETFCFKSPHLVAVPELGVALPELLGVDIRLSVAG